MARFLGIDYGTVRVGVAISDDQKIMAFPYAIMTGVDIIEQIIRLCQQETIEGIVVGRPTPLRTNTNEQTEKVDVFITQLKQAVHIPVYSEDERMSTKAARAVMQPNKKRASSARDHHDNVAAALILQTFLDRQ